MTDKQIPKNTAFNMKDKENGKPKIEFAPGSFDNFEGTQEELDEFIAEITAMAESGELLENSEPLNLEALFEEDPLAAIELGNKLGLFEELVDENGNAVSVEDIIASLGLERNRTLN